MKKYVFTEAQLDSLVHTAIEYGNELARVTKPRDRRPANHDMLYRTFMAIEEMKEKAEEGESNDA